jgi:hypothetical protein
VSFIPGMKVAAINNGQRPSIALTLDCIPPCPLPSRATGNGMIASLRRGVSIQAGSQPDTMDAGNG